MGGCTEQMGGCTEQWEVVHTENISKHTLEDTDTDRLAGGQPQLAPPPRLVDRQVTPPLGWGEGGIGTSLGYEFRVRV